MAKQVNKYTILALCSVMPIADVVKLTGRSRSTIRNWLMGDRSLEVLHTDIDVEYVTSLGFKICQCCGVRLIPKQPVRGQILTRLCEMCWSSEFAQLDDYKRCSPKDEDDEGLEWEIK